MASSTHDSASSTHYSVWAFQFHARFRLRFKCHPGIKFVMEKRGEHQEVAIGLAARIFKFITKSDFDRVFEESSGVTKSSLILELIKVFERHSRPSHEVPNIRRFSIELLMVVMEMDRVAMLSSLSMEMTIKLKGALAHKSAKTGSKNLQRLIWTRHYISVGSLFHRVTSNFISLS